MIEYIHVFGTFRASSSKYLCGSAPAISFAPVYRCTRCSAVLIVQLQAAVAVENTASETWEYISAYISAAYTLPRWCHGPIPTPPFVFSNCGLTHCELRIVEALRRGVNKWTCFCPFTSELTNLRALEDQTALSLGRHWSIEQS